MADDNLKWGAISDFRPGIRHVVNPSNPPGTASEYNTYGCFAVPSGSLHPLPRITRTFYHEAPTSPDLNLAEEFRIIGLHANGPAYWPGETLPGEAQNNTEVVIGIEWWTNESGQDHLRLAVDRYFRHYNDNPTWENIWSEVDDHTYEWTIRPRNMMFASQRSNSADPTTAGPIVLGWVCSGHTGIFPDDTNQYVNSTTYMPGDIEDDAASGGLVWPDGLIAHQGRMVIFPLLVVGNGSNSVYTTNEALYWTSVNDATTLDQYLTGYFNVLAGWENPTGYGVMASLTANELLLVKQRGGGLIVRGDLTDYNATTLPYLRGTGLSMNIGARSPLGYMYPVDNGGVYLWQGGDTCQHITPSMNPNFWRPLPWGPAGAADEDKTPNGWGHGWTQCCDWNEWTLFPNNWLFDSDTQGWWRIADPNEMVVHRWSVENRNRWAYACPSGFRDESDPAVWEFDLITPTRYYSWQSHPIAHTIDRMMEVREVVMVATGRGTLRVTLTSSEEAEGQVLTFLVDSWEKVTTIRLPARLAGSHITFRIESEADDTPEGYAPLVHELRYGYREIAHIARS